MRRALVVSHPAVIAVNQLPYADLQDLGWDVTLAVPANWRHEYAADPFPHEVLPALEGRVIGCSVLKAGEVQRHVYVRRPGAILRHVRPDVVFVEEEPTSIPGLQWGRACHAARVPFGLQMDENLDRDYPWVARAIRGWSLRNAAFVAARSPAAAKMARSWGYEGPTPIVPHGVPDWPEHPEGREEKRAFTVGFAGRFVEEKGLWDLVEAVRGMPETCLRLFGNGPMLDELRGVDLPSGSVEVVTNVTHNQMASAYATLDVLVLPSRTTPTWTEQFGRVLVEAMWCGVPVVGSDSGEIPWVIETTGGGLVFEEGDVEGLRRCLEQLRHDPGERERLASNGRAAVAERFSVSASARDLDAVLREALGESRG